MKAKKLLTLILAFCLMLSVLAPAASAIHVAGENTMSVVRGEENKTTGYDWLDKLLVSAGEKLGFNTSLRDLETLPELSLKDGKWVSTYADGTTVELKDSELPSHIKALQEAAEEYQPMDKVIAFVTLSSDPTAERYSAIGDVPAAETAALEAEQEAMIAVLEQQLGEVKIVTQFTYLTNSIVIETEFENLEPIAAIKGVKSVFLSPTYEACKVEENVSPMTESSSVMSNVATVWQELGYTGAGMTIAILDTGTDLDHPSFAADPESPLWDVEWLQEMLDNYDLRLEELYGAEITAEDLYYNAKIPFHFNYALGTTDVLHNDGVGDHGTHVAGIAAANYVEGSGVVGMAPDAQIIAMKVFSPSGGASMYTIIEALQDCMILGVDVANMSLGSPAGFSETDIEEIDSIFARIAESDLIVDVAAGNEGTSTYGSNWGANIQLTDHIDNATISSPSTYVNSMSVGSVDNQWVPSDYYALADGTKIFYMSSIEVLYEYTDITMQTLIELGEIEYVMIDALGVESDFYDEEGNSIVEGKVAVIKRGEITFGEKVANAEAAGAVAAIIWNHNDDEDIFVFGMTTSVTNEDGEEVYPGIPTALISLSDGNAMAAAETKTMTVPSDFAYRQNGTGGQMSNFSCWGVSPDLRLLPDIAGVGGQIYSCYDEGLYGLMSGTSMATPQVAGVTAVVLQYLKETFPEISDAERRVLVDSLLMSTAVTVIDNESQVEASPRQQGAGLVDALAAITAEAFLTVEGSERPKAELFDDVNGEYTFTFSVHNFSDTEKTYTLRASLLCEDYVDYYGYYVLAEQDRALDNSAVTFSRNTVTVAPNATEEITVTIKLTDADKEWINTYFPNGNYVEGFVYLEGEEEVTLSLPFLGFYGQWDDAPLFDEGLWYSDGTWLDEYYITHNYYPTYLFTSLGSSNYDWVPGMNAYVGVQYVYDEEGWPHVYFDAENMVLSPNGDGVMDCITEYYMSLMRNAEEIYIDITDADGNLMNEGYNYLWKESKTMYISGYGSVVPTVYSWTYDENYDFSNFQHGDVAYITIKGVIDYEGAEWDVLLDKMPIYIDTKAPVLDETKIVESSEEVEFVDEETGETYTETRNYITLTFTEDHPAAVITMNYAQTQFYDYYNELEHFVDNGDGTHSVKLDITGLGDKITVAICDYGCNEAYYNLTYTLTDNNPEMDESALYAYQVYHDGLLYYYGYDYMFGWSTIDKLTAESTMINSDAYEYYGLTAAEYVDGYIFAVDAGYNLLYMAPGVWNRTVICNLGMNVVDLAFDETTGTMYAAVSDKNSSTYGLYTVDLLTGDMTKLRNYGDQYEMPWAMTVIDGKMYCTHYYNGGLYEVKLSRPYTQTAVTDAEGNAVVINGSNGSAVRPYYAQSMTYSKEDGVIYWAYYSGQSSDLITIDPATWTSQATAMAWEQEFVGVLMLDTEYTLPASTEVSKVTMTESQVIMGIGKTHSLSANALPWNAPEEARQLTWTSSDETVATVDQNGVVTAIGEGTITITATCNGISASCTVVVVDISGHMNAYKYYDGNYNWGYWLDIDLAKTTEEATFESPVDFIAADYNGHTGIIYGYDEVGQCYWFNPTTGEYGMLGDADTSKIPADMAYDYTTGLMYVIDYSDTAWSSTLYTLNMNTGKLDEVATGADVYVTLACDDEGQLYTINYDGVLSELNVVQGTSGGGGGGIMPMADTELTYVLSAKEIMQTPVSEIYYLQTMCYDYSNDAILWINTETFCIYWLGGLDSDEPYAVALGEPSGSGVIQYVGAYVIPETIEPLPYVAVESVEAEDVLVLTGASVAPSVNAYPVNATNGKVSEWSVADESVAYVEDDRLVGVAAGKTTVTATIVDTDPEGNETRYSVTFTVIVKENTDNIYGYLVGDLANNDGTYWVELDDATTGYQGISYAYYQGMYLTIYSAEYVDGMIYAYGFNAEDWNANFLFLTIDAKTWAVTDCIDMGDGFPFVYDMAYDYTTGTMYAVAGPNDDATDLYYVNLETGKLIDCMNLEPMIMSLAIDANGTIYGMAAGAEDFDPLDWVTTYYNAMLYTLDPVNGTYELFMDTGFKCNMLSSMSYDHDTGYIYWTCLFSGTGYESGLKLIDLDEKAVYDLGTIGGAGAQVTGLMVIADAYPDVPTNLSNIAITTGVNEVSIGGKVALEAFCQPSGLDLELTWTSADESIATVNANGVVTGVSAGVTTITVTGFDGEVTRTATCTVIVYGAEDYFVSYDKTNGGFVTISRPDSISTLYPDAEDAADVTALEMVDGIVYGFDKDNNLFFTSMDADFQRTVIGNPGIEVEEPYSESKPGYYSYEYYYEYFFTIRDMSWDAANNRMLALGVYGLNKYVDCTYPNGQIYSYVDHMELEGGCRLYEVDMTTGALTEVSRIYRASGDYYSGVYAMEVTDDGDVYIFSSYIDYICSLDMETGITTDITTFQNMGVYPSSDGDSMALTYDANTHSLFMLMTRNGNRYFLYQFDIATGIISLEGELSEEDRTYAGLAVNDPHACSFGEWTVETPATCEEDGEERRYCECGHYETRVIEATGHSFGEWTVETPATCTEDGEEHRYCDCGEYETRVIEATGHSFGEWTVETPATCEEDGVEKRTCACGETETRVIEAHGHSYVDGYCEHCGEEDASNPPTGSINVLAMLALTAMSVTAGVIITKRKSEE